MDLSAPLLGADAPVPIHRPFTRQEALAGGCSWRTLKQLAVAGLIRSPLKGVWCAAQLPDGLELRVACLRLVTPADAVVTDRTAGWMHMAPMVLAPGDHLVIPRVDMFRAPGNRIRSTVVRSGERTFLPGEIVEIDGIHVTSKLRTFCDLGMQLPRRQAFAGMCSMSKVADFPLADVIPLAERRFRGYRWVRQLKSLTPLVDPRFESPGECNLALAWHDEGDLLPPFEPQLEVPGIAGSFFLDLGVPSIKYGAEYDGPRWHGPERSEHDRTRRSFLEEEGGWTIDVFLAHHVSGPQPVVGDLLRTGVRRARRAYGRQAWTGQDRTA